MRPVSTGFIGASLSPVGYANAYVTINGNTINASKMKEVTIQENIGESGAFSIGSFNTSEISLSVLTSALPNLVTGVPINAYFGYYVSGSYEYVPMGTFYAQPKDVTTQGLFTTIRGYDKSIRLTDTYTSSLNWSNTHTVAQVLSEIQTATSISMGSYGGLAPGSVTVYEQPKGTHRDVIMQMAILMGTNAKLNRTGSLDFIKAYPSTPVQEYGAYNYSSSNFQLTSNAPISFGRLTVNYTHTVSGEEVTDTFNYTAGSGSNTITLETVNVRTQAKTNTLGQAIYGSSGLSYYGYNATLPGQPQIDLGDTIRIEDVFGHEYDLLVLSATHTFNGAMKTTFSAVANEQDPSLNGDGMGTTLTEQVGTINDATTYAVNRAEYAATKADEAAASADEAQRQAGIATESANTAVEQAGIATTNANEAIRQAGIATDNADEAVRQAGIATTSANEAKTQANTATKYANSALDQLGVVQDVIGVLNWATEHGTFTATTDTTVQEGKVYFVYDSSTGDYTPVVSPDASQISNYYELTVDEAMESFIMSHLAVTARGLWVLPNGYGTANDAQYAVNYKVLLAHDGLYIYDGDGVLVATYGESIIFSSERPQSIGNSNAGISFNPSGQGSITITGAEIDLAGGPLKDWIDTIEDAAEENTSDIALISKDVSNLSDTVDGAIYYQYTLNGTTYDVWAESNGSETAYYYEYNGVKTPVEYEDLDESAGEKVTVYRAGILGSINALEERLSGEEEKSESLEARASTAESEINRLDGSLANYDQFIRITPNPASILLGARDGETLKSGVEITASNVNFKADGITTAYASGQTFNAPEGNFENISMKTTDGTGNLRWIARSNGHLSLKVVN